MKVNIEWVHVWAILTLLSSCLAGVFIYAYNADKQIAQIQNTDLEEDFKEFKIEYNIEIKNLKSDVKTENKAFINKMESIGKAQQEILERIYNQAFISSKDVQEVKLEMAKTSGSNALLSSKMDSILTRIDTNTRRINDLEVIEKKIAPLQDNVEAINKVLNRMSKEKKISFFNWQYGYGENE